MIRARSLASLLGLLPLAVTSCSGSDVSAHSAHQSVSSDEDHHGHGARSHHHDHDGARGHQHGEHGDGADAAGTERHRIAARRDRTERMGQVVPNFAVTDNHGNEFRLASLRRSSGTKGKIVVLTFWCTTCHSCREIEREFDKKAAAYASEDAVFHMVDSNVPDYEERVNGFLEANGLGFKVLMDAESAIAGYFGARFTTTTAVLDADGRLRYYGGFAKAEDAVRDLLAGEEVALPESSGGG